MSAIEQGGAPEAIATLMQRIESLQKEKTNLQIELNEIKKEHTVVPRISKNDIADRMRSLDKLLKDPRVANKERRMAVRYFIRQLHFSPQTGEIRIYFWPNPANNTDRLKVLKNKEEDRAPSSNKVMISNGAGDRERIFCTSHGPTIMLVSGN
jgi:hypothetical protein